MRPIRNPYGSGGWQGALMLQDSLSSPPEPMTFRTFAVQPIAWGNFDEHGCQWAGDINTAFRIGKNWGERCMVWAVPDLGAPMKWCRCDEISDAISDLVFGV